MKAHSLAPLTLTLAALLLPTLSAVAQPGFQPPVAPPGPAPAPVAQVAAGQTWGDVWVLWMPQRLSLSVEQARQIAAIVQPVGQRLEADRAGREAIWARSGTALQTVIAAWCDGTQPDAASLNAGDAAADQASALDDALSQDREDALQAFLQVLSEDQQALVETDEAAENRRRAQERFEGAPDLATYIANQLIALRRLMPDDYDLLREDTATRIISRTVRAGADEARVEQARATVLQLMDEAFSMDDAQFDQLRPDLPAQVTDYLHLPQSAPRAPISAEEFRAWVGDPRTPAYLALYGTNSAPLASAPPAATDPLTSALRQAQALTFFQDLRLGQTQLGQLSTLVADANSEAHRTQAQKESYLQQQLPTLTQALPYLVTGQPLPEAWNTYFAGVVATLDEYDTGLDRAIATTTELLDGVLTPGQAARLELQAPAALGGGPSLTEQAQARAERIGKLREVIRLVEGMRPLDLMTFLQVRLVRIQDFLNRYLNPGDGDTTAIRDRIAEQITEVYGIPADQWQQRAPEVAAQILDTAGLGDEQSRRPDTQPEMSWQQLRDLLVADETLQVLQRITGTGTGPAPR